MWRALNDMEVLRDCIPGCQKLERVSETVIEATIAAQIGPVKAPFVSRIELKNLDPPRAYTLVGEGKSAAAGFGRGEARGAAVLAETLRPVRPAHDPASLEALARSLDALRRRREPNRVVRAP